MNEIQTMKVRPQMELGIGTDAARKNRPSRRRGLPNARWWFAHMHRVVNEAVDWRPAPGKSAEQILLRIEARN